MQKDEIAGRWTVSPTSVSSVARPGRKKALPDDCLRRLSVAVYLGITGLGLNFISGLAAAAAEAPPVSWTREIRPIFNENCDGCHNPNKLKGGVDTSTYAAFARDGKNGPSYSAGDPVKSRVLEKIRGPEPSMPKEGPPLTASQVQLVERWILEGARDDSPALRPKPRREPFRYSAPPVISAVAVSPDASLIAVSGYQEVLVIDADKLELKFRWSGDAPRIEALAFSPDGKSLAVAGGEPAVSGELQLWDVPSGTIRSTAAMGADVAWSVTWSPDGSRIAVGCADNRARIVGSTHAKELFRIESHRDGVLRTAWSADGSRLATAGRDPSIKWFEGDTGKWLDEICKPFEPVTAMVRHPSESWAAVGGSEGSLCFYHLRERPDRNQDDKDSNLIRTLEKVKGTVHALAVSPDGSRLAASGREGDLRIYATADGRKLNQISGLDGDLFALAFSVDGRLLFGGGFDGLLRAYDSTNGTLQMVMVPVPLER